MWQAVADAHRSGTANTRSSPFDCTSKMRSIVYGRQQLHAIRAAAQRYRRQHARQRPRVAVTVGRADVGVAPRRGVGDAGFWRRIDERLAHRIVFGQLIEGDVQRRRRDHLGDASVVLGPRTDLDVGAEWAGDLVADELFQRSCRSTRRTTSPIR